MPLNLTRRAALALPLIAALPRSGFAQAGFAQAGFAQEGEWRPARTVRMIVPQGAGGTTDVMARLLSAHLQQRWGQSVIVDNKAGAGGVIGTQEAIRAAADGYTILMGNVGAQAIAYQLMRSLPYKPDDLTPVAGMIDGPNALIVNSAIAANTVPEFVAYLKKTPNVSFGTPGIGTTPHLAAVWFNKLAGTESVALHYRGSGPAMIDLYAGATQYSFDALVNSIEAIRSGRVKVLGVTGTERYPLLPDVPTIRETMPALSGFVSNSWVGLFLRTGVSAAAIQSLHAGVQSLLNQPDMNARFLALGGVPIRKSQPEFASYVREETAKWTAVISSAGLSGNL